MRFTAPLEQKGKTATGIPVPPAVLDALGAGKRPPVSVTINGHTWRTSIGSVDGLPMIPVSAEQRQAAGVRAGDLLDVEIEVDSAPRTVDVPPDLAAALDADPAARAAFDRLSYSHKRQHVLAVKGTQNPDTRRRRIEKALAMLRDE